MKVFCALLLVGIIAYVKADHDECDRYAANTLQKAESSSGEHTDQVIPLKKFLQHNQLQFFVTKASKSNVQGSSEFCTAPTHGNGCLAVGYWRKITKQPNAEKDKGADEIEFSTVFVAEGKDYAVKYEMKIAGVNADDYIFKGTDDPIRATIIHPDGSTEDVTAKLAKTAVYEILKNKFALWYASDNGFSIYVTCDMKAMWLSYSSAIVAAGGQGKDESEVQEWVNNLKKKIPEGTAAPQMIDIAVDMKDLYKAQIPQITAH